VQQDQLESLSGGLASMGAAVPYAIGAKFAYPDCPVVALVGDGAMQMNNNAVGSHPLVHKSIRSISHL
jgi:pyruvate dehydrogenase (quinone)